MRRIVIISKNGTETPHFTRVQLTSELFRPAGVRVSPEFCCRASWPGSTSDAVETEICVYGKAEGPERYLNTYQFPPPFAELKLFGTCIVAQHSVSDPDVLIDLDLDAWTALRNGTIPIHTSVLPSVLQCTPRKLTASVAAILSPIIPPIADSDAEYLNCAMELQHEPYLPDDANIQTQ